MFRIKLSIVLGEPYKQVPMPNSEEKRSETCFENLFITFTSCVYSNNDIKSVTSSVLLYLFNLMPLLFNITEI